MNYIEHVALCIWNETKKNYVERKKKQTEEEKIAINDNKFHPTTIKCVL